MFPMNTSCHLEPSASERVLKTSEIFLLAVIVHSNRVTMKRSYRFFLRRSLFAFFRNVSTSAMDFS